MLISTEMIDWFESELSLIQSRGKRDDLVELKKLTVIIPTYGRQSYLLRQVLYWADSSVTLIIVDGSEFPCTQLEQLKISGGLSFQYIHCPKSFPHRLSLAGTMIRTPFAVLLGDDEFHLKSGLISALESLVSDRSLSGCIGQSMGFSLNDNALRLGSGYPHSHYRVMEDKIADRLNKAMVKYNAATCYAVLTKTTWVSSWGDLHACSSPYAEEIQQALATYIAGKFSSVQTVYWMRSYDEPVVSILGEYDRTLSFSSWWKGKAYRLETEKFVTHLAGKVLAAGGAESLIHARDILNDAIEIYITGIEQRNSDSLLRHLFRKTAGLIRQNFNFKFIAQLNSWLSRSASSSLGYDHLLNFGSIAELQLSVVKDDFKITEVLINELEEIQMLVVEHSKRR